MKREKSTQNDSLCSSMSFRRINDLKGRGSPFPPLSNMESLRTM